MTIIQQLQLFVQSLSKAHGLIWYQGFWKWMLVPLFVQLLLFSFIFWIGLKTGQYVLQEWVLEWIKPLVLHLPHWIEVVLLFLLVWAVKILVFGLYMAIYKYVILIVLSPFWSYLSDLTEAYLTGHEVPWNLSTWLAQVMRGIKISLRNAFWEVVFMVILFLAAGLPFFGLLVPVLGFLVQAYYFGFSMMDYSLERRHWPVSKSAWWMKEHKWLCICIGSIFLSTQWVPAFLGLWMGWLGAGVFSKIFFIPVILFSVTPVYCILTGSIAGLTIKNHP